MAIKPVRKEVTLPVSGATLTVRKLGPYDYVYLGAIPDVLAPIKSNPKKVLTIKDLKPADLDYTIKTTIAALVKHPEGQILSHKKPPDCRGVELSFMELDFQDQEALINAVNELNEGGAAEKLHDFPEEKKPGD